MFRPTALLLAVATLPLQISARRQLQDVRTDAPDTLGVFSIPIKYAPSSDSVFMATFAVGSEKTELQVIMDLGSTDSWIYGQNNNVTWGGIYMAGPFPCSNQSAPYYTPNTSTTAEIFPASLVAPYGGGSKFVYGNISVIDTLSPEPGKTGPRLPVAVANFATLRSGLDPNCSSWASIYQSDGIFGIGSSTNTDYNIQGNPWDIRYNVLHPPAPQTPLIESASMSVFLRNATTTPALGTFQGEVLLGGIDTSAFVGPLVSIADFYHDQNEGYYVPLPNLRSAGRNVTLNNTTIFNIYGRCLLDSGTSRDIWPVVDFDANYQFDPQAFEEETGLIDLSPAPGLASVYAYPSACADIPFNATFDFTWPSPSDKEITIKVPIRNYARNPAEINGDACVLDIFTGTCTLGATILSAAYMVVDDDTGTLGLAQSGEGEGGRIAIGSGGEFQVSWYRVYVYDLYRVQYKNN